MKPTKSTLILCVVALSSLVLMAYQMIAARLIAPILGSSFYTWSSTIGFVLLGLAVGVWIGAIISKKKYSFIVPFGFFLSGMSMLAVVFLKTYLLNFVANSDLSLPMLSIIVSFVLVFFQTALLSLATPTFLKIITKTFDSLDKEYSTISFFGSIGSIIGVFLGGFYLIPNLGVYTSTIVLSILCIFLSLLSLYILFSEKKVFKKSLLLWFIASSTVLVTIILEAKKTEASGLNIYDSAYYQIHIYDHPFNNIEKTRWLFLDFDSHSIDTGGVRTGGYTDVAHIVPLLGKQMHTMAVLGAGAYTIPKTLASYFPELTIDVFEIDQKIPVVAEEYFNLREYTNITTIIGDPRLLIPKRAKKYDLIFNDIYHSFISVPSHVVSQEFMKTMKDHLTPDGLYMMSFIAQSKGEGSELVHHINSTAESMFTDVRVLVIGNPEETGVYSFVLFASDTLLPENEVLEFYVKREVPGSENYAFFDTIPKVRVFTDD